MKVVENERGSDGKKATETDKESDSSTREDGAYARRMSAFVSRFSGVSKRCYVVQKKKVDGAKKVTRVPVVIC